MYNSKNEKKKEKETHNQTGQTHQLKKIKPMLVGLNRVCQIGGINHKCTPLFKIKTHSNILDSKSERCKVNITRKNDLKFCSGSEGSLYPKTI